MAFNSVALRLAETLLSFCHPECSWIKYLVVVSRGEPSGCKKKYADKVSDMLASLCSLITAQTVYMDEPWLCLSNKN